MNSGISLKFDDDGNAEAYVRHNQEDVKWIDVCVHGHPCEKLVRSCQEKLDDSKRPGTENGQYGDLICKLLKQHIFSTYRETRECPIGKWFVPKPRKEEALIDPNSIYTEVIVVRR